MKGNCLCGAVEFELSGEIPKLYQCHCSLCRKVTGSSANAALIIPVRQFEWLRGHDQISEYESETGFKSYFCRACGSPLPNPTRENRAWWVPAGLLEDSSGLELAAHLYVGSRASWDIIAGSSLQFDQMPDAATLDRLLERVKPVT